MVNRPSFVGADSNSVSWASGARPRRRANVARTALMIGLAAALAACATSRTKVMTDKNRPAPAVDAAPAAMRALTIAVSKAADCSETCTSDKSVCLPKQALDNFVTDLRAALQKSGFKVAEAESARGDVVLDACVRPTAGAEKTAFWVDTGRKAPDFWDPDNGEFGKDPDGFLWEVATPMCPTAGRKIVIGRMKSEGYDSGAASAAIVNRLTACDTLLKAAQAKAGGASAPTPAAAVSQPAPAASASSPASAAAPATTAPAATDAGDEDMVELTDKTVVRGQITREEPGTVVVVQRADGRSETIPWASVAKVTHRTEDDVVHLKDGSFVRGKVLKENPGKAVVIKRTDGPTDTIPWDEITRVVRGRKKK